MITLVLFGKPGIFHGSPPAVTQVTHHPAVECVVPGHLGDRDVQQIIQPLEDPKPECDFRQLRIFFIHQCKHHVRIVDIVGEYSGEPVLVSGIAVRTIKYMIRLSGNACNPRNRTFLPGQHFY